MRHIKTQSACGGFSLVEVAIALVIIALLSAGALTALRVQTVRAQTAEARGQLQDAREALLNFASVSGYLPCPDTDGDGEPNACSTTNTDRRLPWKTLGLPASDAWGQALHYKVTRHYTQTECVSLNTAGNIGLLPNSLGDSAAIAFAVWSSGVDAATKSDASATAVVAEAADSDDIVIWVSRYIVLGRMLEAGLNVNTHVPASVTTCS